MKWAFETGTANAISGCADVSESSPGIAMTVPALPSIDDYGSGDEASLSQDGLNRASSLRASLCDEAA